MSISDPIVPDTYVHHVSPTPVHDFSDSTCVPRRSDRTKTLSSHLKVYECALPPSLQHDKNISSSTTTNLVYSGSQYPISSYIFLANLSQSYACFTAQIYHITEPTTYKQAFKSKDWQ